MLRREMVTVHRYQTRSGGLMTAHGYVSGCHDGAPSATECYDFFERA